MSVGTALSVFAHAAIAFWLKTGARRLGYFRITTFPMFSAGQRPGIGLALPPGVSALPAPAQHAEVRAAGDETAPVLIVPNSGLSIEDLERAAIAFALERTHGNRTQAARFLGLSRSALLYRMRKHRIVIPHQS